MNTRLEEPTQSTTKIPYAEIREKFLASQREVDVAAARKYARSMRKPAPILKLAAEYVEENAQKGIKIAAVNAAGSLALLALSNVLPDGEKVPPTNLSRVEVVSDAAPHAKSVFSPTSLTLPAAEYVEPSKPTMVRVPDADPNAHIPTAEERLAQASPQSSDSAGVQTLLNSSAYGTPADRSIPGAVYSQIPTVETSSAPAE